MRLCPNSCMTVGSDRKIFPSPPPGRPPVRKPTPPAGKPTHLLTVSAKQKRCSAAIVGGNVPVPEPQQCASDTGVDDERKKIAATISSATAAIQQQWSQQQVSPGRAITTVVPASSSTCDEPRKQNGVSLQLEPGGASTTGTTVDCVEAVSRHTAAKSARSLVLKSAPNQNAGPVDRASSAGSTKIAKSSQEPAGPVRPAEALESTELAPMTSTSSLSNTGGTAQACRQFFVGCLVAMAFEEPDGTLRDWQGRVDQIEKGSHRMKISFEDGTVETDVDPADPDLKVCHPGRRLYGKQGKNSAPDARENIQNAACSQDSQAVPPTAAPSEWTAEESENLRKLGGRTHWTADEDAQLKRLVEQDGTGNWSSKSERFSTPRSASGLQKRWKKIQENRGSDAADVDDSSTDGEESRECDTELDKELGHLGVTSPDAIALEVLDSAILRRSSLVSWCVRPDFNQMVKGCLVRVAEPGKSQERCYYTGLITGVFEFRQQYTVCGRSTAQGLLLQRHRLGIDKRQTETVRLNVISNLVPSRQELLSISRELKSLEALTLGRVKVCTRAQELSRDLHTQAAAKEVARAKALITKWNSLGNTKRLKDAVALHTKLIKAFEASDWLTLQSSCPDFNPYSREIADDSMVWAMLMQVVDLTSPLCSATASTKHVATPSPRRARQVRHRKGTEMHPLQESRKQKSSRFSNSGTLHGMTGKNNEEHRRRHKDSGQGKRRQQIASLRDNSKPEAVLVHIDLSADSIQCGQTSVTSSSSSSSSSKGSQGGEKNSLRQSLSPPIKRQAVVSAGNPKHEVRNIPRRQRKLGRYRVLRRAIVRAGCDRLSETVGILEMGDIINVVQVKASLGDGTGHDDQELLRFNTVSSGSAWGHMPLNGWTSVRASSGGPMLLEYAGPAHTRAMSTQPLPAPPRHVGGSAMAADPGAVAKCVTKTRKFDTSDRVDDATHAAELANSFLQQPQQQPSQYCQKQRDHHCGGHRQQRQLEQHQQRHQHHPYGAVQVGTVDSTVAQMLGSLGASLDLDTLEQTLKEQELLLQHEIMTNMDLSEADIAALPQGTRAQYLATRTAHRQGLEVYVASSGGMPPHPTAQQCRSMQQDQTMDVKQQGHPQDVMQCHWDRRTAPNIPRQHQSTPRPSPQPHRYHPFPRDQWPVASTRVEIDRMSPREGENYTSTWPRQSREAPGPPVSRHRRNGRGHKRKRRR